ncbi:MAG: UDP-N-acetylmuramate dehydrogenase [Deltaproteobacteria bacterium]|nr:UDP-N-acetylmuramate dehydrogenase [Deltaproteobacteria bacterium]
MSRSVPLAPLTTFGLGGPALSFAEVRETSDLTSALDWARGMGLPVFILGGGSNLVVADEGFAGLVLRLRTRGRRWSEQGRELVVEAAAGEAWDDVVADAVARNAAGIECLSGIPGSAGAAPVQNIGAYGQEVASVVRQVRVLDRRSLEERWLDADACGFGYRDSIFRRKPERFVILSVALGLAKDGAPSLRYPELAAAVGASPPLGAVRDAVLALRRKKGMVVDAADPDSRSVGSFFTNPIVGAAVADEIAARAGAEMPRYPLPDGRVKLAAAWLIERAGIAKGLRMGPVGVSAKHALALVHHGGGKTADLLRLARHVRQTVFDRFGVSLVPEPVFLGVAWPG